MEQIAHQVVKKIREDSEGHTSSAYIVVYTLSVFYM